MTVFLGVLGILVGVFSFWGMQGFKNLARQAVDKASDDAAAKAMKILTAEYNRKTQETGSSKIDAAVGDKNQSNPSQKTTTTEELK